MSEERSESRVSIKIVLMIEEVIDRILWRVIESRVIYSETTFMLIRDRHTFLLESQSFLKFC